VTVRSGASPRLVLTCEHAGNRIPREHAALFAGARDVLASHEGWDPGALRLARLFARRLDVPLLATTWSRLLVEGNRASTNPRIWSRFTRDLPRAERLAILERYWRPHRDEAVAAVADGARAAGRVVHVAVHTFTPALRGVVRNADVAFLYDASRRREAAFARRWAALLAARAPHLRVRFNYPYRGRDDGLPTALRRLHAESRYVGYELEVNQALATTSAWRRTGDALAESLAAALPAAFAGWSR